MIAMDFEPILEREAKERQIAAQNNEKGRAVRTTSSSLVKGKSIDIAAKMMGSSRDSAWRLQISWNL